MREVRIYLPTKTKDRKPVEATTLRYVERCAVNDLCDLFGGCTTFQATGHWINKDGDRLDEKVTVLCSYFPGEESASKLERIQEIAEEIRKWLDQEAVLYTTQNVRTVVFVEKSKER